VATELGESAEHLGSPDSGRGTPSRWIAVRGEVGLALELAALVAFAFSRPVLDSFGRSPETFIARGADAWTIVGFGVVVALVPVLAVVAVGLAGRLLGPRVRRWVHVALIAVLAGVAAWRLGQDMTDWGPLARRLIAAGVVAGVVVGLLRARLPIVGTFLRYAGAASLIFFGHFLFLSPTSTLVVGDGTGFDNEVARQVAAQLGEDPPHVAMMVFDALPTVSLLDGTGHIDAEQFPNFARLASTSTWYRNHTTVGSDTIQAVPAILTGRYPAQGSPKSPNLFTLLGGAYNLQVHEHVTRLCPAELCPEATSPELRALLGDAVSLWRNGAAGPSGDDELPGALGTDRYDVAEQWIADLQVERDQPQLLFYHAVIPHLNWVFTEDGSLYRTTGFPPGMFAEWWTDTGYGVGEQRHLLQTQAADRLLGHLLDRLEAAGTLDDTLVVVAADHGAAFLPGEPHRALTEGNLSQIAWTPLLIKAPEQIDAVVDDRHVETIDIVPTIADLLGFDVPRDVDGVAATTATPGRGDKMWLAAREADHLQPDEGEDLVEIDGERARAAFDQVLAANPIPAAGPEAVWRRTEHSDLLGREIATLDLGPEAGGTIAIDALDDLQRQDPGEVPLLEVVGRTGLPEGRTVAYALNGTVAALTEVEPPYGDPERNTAVALVPPKLLVEGDNELAAYVVEGPPGKEVLRHLAVEARESGS
jgi:hypothetical protein